MLGKDTPDTQAGSLQPAVTGWVRSILILALALIQICCAGPARIRWPMAVGSPPETFRLNPVPFFPQTEFQCGPASLAMALAWSGVSVSPETLSQEVYTPARKGSLQPAMIAAVRRHDRIAYLLPGPEALVDEVAAGHPVIVLQNLGLSWYPVWHYAVVVGLDGAGGNIVLHSGKTPCRLIAVDVFERTWARSGFWGLLVLPPSQLPACAEETDYLRAVSHLERLGKYETAVKGYQGALNRWPNSLPAHLGLGVCRFELGELTAAEAVFRRATVKFPADGAAFNNLAQVLLAQGRKNEALDAVMQAIERGGPLRAYFESTLEAIRLQAP